MPTHDWARTIWNVNVKIRLRRINGYVLDVQRTARCSNGLLKGSFIIISLCSFVMHVSVADPGGGGRNRRPKNWFNYVFLFHSLIRMLKTKAQIARESIKTTLELPAPLSGPWTPAESEFGFALVMYMLAHNLLRPPPPPPHENPGSGPVFGQYLFEIGCMF